jgi:hypothetical protein
MAGLLVCSGTCLPALSLVVSAALQEGHTAHATAEEAEEEAMRFVRIYEDFATQVCVVIREGVPGR